MTIMIRRYWRLWRFPRWQPSTSPTTRWTNLEWKSAAFYKAQCHISIGSTFLKINSFMIQRQTPPSSKDSESNECLNIVASVLATATTLDRPTRCSWIIRVSKWPAFCCRRGLLAWRWISGTHNYLRNACSTWQRAWRIRGCIWRRLISDTVTWPSTICCCFPTPLLWTPRLLNLIWVIMVYSNASLNSSSKPSSTTRVSPRFASRITC